MLVPLMGVKAKVTVKVDPSGGVTLLAGSENPCA